jgi:DNA primase
VARVPEAELERLKREVSVVRLAEARGVKLRRRGEELLGLCPFHDDKEPSLVINQAKNLWHCLGACGEGGSVIDWVMKAEGVSFRHAVELLRADLPAPSGKDAEPVRQSTVQKLPSPLDFDAEDQELLAQVVDYYHETLKGSKKAMKYLGSRGIAHPEAIERFRLGYANRTLGYRLPNKQRKAGADIRGRLRELGIYRDSGHEHFNGCLVVPVFDEEGRVAEIYGRKVTRALKKRVPLHLYLPGPHRGVWNVEALAESKEVILTESLIDALTFWSAGFRNVTAAYGTSGFTEEHLEAFRRHQVERVLLAFDRDDAGEKAAAKVAERLGRVGIACFRVCFPRGMDANEYALKVEPAKKSLGLVLRNAIYLGEGPEPSRSPDQAPAKPEPPVAKSATSPASAPTKRAAKEEKAPVGDPEATEPPATPDEPATAPPLAAGRGSAEASPAASQAPLSAPAAPTPPDVPTEVKPEEVVIRLGDRRYRVRGLAKNMSYDVLRVNLLVSRPAAGGEAFHVDTLNLYAARQRAAFLRQASDELHLAEPTLKEDLGRVLLKLEELQDAQIRRALETDEEPSVVLSPEERSEALALLEDPRLMERILEDFERAGVVGEETNKLVGYLAAVSRKLEDPLAVIVQSSSAAGKSSLMEAILELVPEEERVSYSAMTGQSLFYMGETDLAHKILAVAEEEGAERASYALKLLQSEGELTIASTGKDPQSGRLVTHEYRVEGPVAIFLTTTAIDVDEELLNRCLVLTVNETREQTRAIHRRQREAQTLEGLVARQERDAIVRRHKNAQRLLRPLLVANPYARELTFLDARTRTRRDHLKYLTLIRTIALLHQYQREVKTVERRSAGGSIVLDYIEVTLEDIERANQLAGEVLGRTLDEIPPQTRRLLLLIEGMVAEAAEAEGIERSRVHFTRRTVREATGWGNTQLKVHLSRLEDLEYLLVHRGGRGEAKVYELLYEGQGQDGAPFLPGLLDVEVLRSRGYDRNRSGSDGDRSGQSARRSGSSRPQVGGRSGGGRGTEFADNSQQDRDLRSLDAASGRKSQFEETSTTRSRTRSLPLPFAARALGGES